MTKKILLLGGDGYIGWPLAMHLANLGHSVSICDNFNKRKWELEIGVKPLYSVPTLHERVAWWNKANEDHIDIIVGDISNQRYVYDAFSYIPDIVINCADQPSSPFSMKGINTAGTTQSNNIASGLNILFAIKKYCPEALYIRLGANALIDFENPGSVNVHHCSSFYEISKLNDCNNIYFAAKNWGLTAVVINTGVVYDDRTSETMLNSKLKTSFHYDRVFGTIVNRFCVQAILGTALTIFGDGTQQCSVSTLQETVTNIGEIVEQQEHLTGKCTIVNRFAQVLTVQEIAESVKRAAAGLGLEVEFQFLENPRLELIKIRNEVLVSSGERKGLLCSEPLEELLKKIVEYRNTILPDTILPVIQWSVD